MFRDMETFGSFSEDARAALRIALPPLHSRRRASLTSARRRPPVGVVCRLCSKPLPLLPEASSLQPAASHFRLRADDEERKHDNENKTATNSAEEVERRISVRELKRVRLKAFPEEDRFNEVEGGFGAEALEAEEEPEADEERRKSRRKRRKCPRKPLPLKIARNSLILCHSILVLLFILVTSKTESSSTTKLGSGASPPSSSEFTTSGLNLIKNRIYNSRPQHHNHNYNNHRQRRQPATHQRQTGSGSGSGRRARELQLSLAESVAERPVVATKKGLVRGISQRLFTGKNVDAFLGIPYAEPPIGKFRFRHPQPIREWPGELEASKMPNSCYQINDTFFGSNFLGTSIWNANTQLNEDCLYLNIWAPFGSANYTLSTGRLPRPQQFGSAGSGSGGGQGQRSGPLKAVMVWIFGGGFYSGTSSLALYDGGLLASEEDVILVSMNYRVSALGFLYFGRPDAPGNAGLFDQLLALQWIHDNIEQFGGDPNRVTIFGESAGAVSISLHMLSPLSRNLFNQAILQSGAATCPWGLMEIEEIVGNGLQLAQQLNCPHNKSDLEPVMECLRQADPFLLVSQEIGQKTVLNFPFVPVVDGSFLVEPPSESMAKQNFKPARVLLGSNFDEGNSWLVYMSEFSHCPSADKPLESASSPSATGNGPQIGDGPSSSGSVNNGEAADLKELSAEQLVVSSATDNLFNSIQRRQADLESSFATSGSIKQQQEANNFTTNNTQPEGQQHNGENGNGSAEAKPCKPNEVLSLTRDDFFKVLKDDFLNPYAKYQISKEAIVFEYSNWNNPHDSVSNYDALDKIVGDYYFTCHVNEFAQRYAGAGNAVYMYYFKQHSSISPWPKWMGVLHGDEISFVFGEPLNQMFNYTPKEVDLSRRMMGYWANFAKYGNPSKVGENASLPKEERWPEYSDKRLFFELHADYIRVGRGPRAKQCAFWFTYMPQLLDSFNRNCPAHLKQRNPANPSGAWRQKQPASLAIVPSSLLLLLGSLTLVILLILLAVLIYVRQTARLYERFSQFTNYLNRMSILLERRWRNQRAAASLNKQRSAAPANDLTSGLQQPPQGGLPNQAPGGQVLEGEPAQQSANSLRANAPATRQTVQQQASMQLHNLRPAGACVAPAGSGATSGLVSRPQAATTTTSVEQQQPQQVAGGEPEQSALELAQSAAARVTAMAAAAKFKMLRSNTLAAAFGRATGNSAPEPDGGAPMDLLATRTKDDRVVNTLSPPAARLNRG